MYSEAGSRFAKAAVVQPSRGDVHVNRPLTNISIAYMQSKENFIARKVFQNLPVSSQADVYFTYDRGEFNRNEARERAPGTETAGGTHKIDNEAYYCKVIGFHEDVADQVRSNQDSPINLDRDATEFVTYKGLIKCEVDWATKYFATDKWTFEYAGAGTGTALGSLNPTHATNNKIVYWNDDGSTPIETVRSMKSIMGEETGFRPNIMCVGRPTWDALLDHADIIGRLDRGQTSGPAMAMKDAIAALFELDEITVMDSIQNTAGAGSAADHSYIGGKHALLCYRPPRPGMMTPAAGYTFSWTGYVGAGKDGIRVKRFRMEETASDRVEMEMAYDQKQIATDLGFFLKDIVQ